MTALNTGLKKVLVVDDDPVVGRSFDRVLSGKGYAVITAENGEQALDKLAREDYDAVFTDIRMPGMSGIEVAERIKALRPWLPVVIVTGYGSDENQAKAKAAGVNAFLHKPLSPEVIEATARSALTRTVAEPAPTKAPAVTVPKRSAFRNAALLLAAPFIGLVYVVAFPIVGLAVLVWMAVGALMKRDVGVIRFLRNAGLFIAAPFIGLAYAIAFPFVGIGLLAWHGYRAWFGKKGAE